MLKLFHELAKKSRPLCLSTKVEVRLTPRSYISWPFCVANNPKTSMPFLHSWSVRRAVTWRSCAASCRSPTGLPGPLLIPGPGWKSGPETSCPQGSEKLQKRLPEACSVSCASGKDVTYVTSAHKPLMKGSLMVKPKSIERGTVMHIKGRREQIIMNDNTTYQWSLMDLKKI